MIPTSFVKRPFHIVIGLLVLSAAASFGEVAAPAKIVLVGDSTVATGGGWGDGFAKLLKPGVECINLGHNGRSSKSYRAEGWWAKALEAKPAWIFIQFGHNDEPGKGPDRETDPETTYRENMTRYVDEARAAGAQPVLVTSVSRRIFLAGKVVPDLDPKLPRLIPYVEVVRKIAAEKGVPCVDLHARSLDQLEKIGAAAAREYDKPSKDPAVPDTTHLSPKGAAATARLVAAEVRAKIPGLTSLLTDTP